MKTVYLHFLRRSEKPLPNFSMYLSIYTVDVWLQYRSTETMAGQLCKTKVTKSMSIEMKLWARKTCQSLLNTNSNSFLSLDSGHWFFNNKKFKKNQLTNIIQCTFILLLVLIIDRPTLKSVYTTIKLLYSKSLEFYASVSVIPVSLQQQGSRQFC